MKIKPHHLEDSINKAWMITDDLEAFLRIHGDAPQPLSEDEVYNLISGIKNVLELRMMDLWEKYLTYFELDGRTNNGIDYEDKKIQPRNGWGLPHSFHEQGGSDAESSGGKEFY